jgi:hypothetical protein
MSVLAVCEQRSLSSDPKLRSLNLSRSLPEGDDIDELTLRFFVSPRVA